MISALAKAARVFDEPPFLEEAIKSVRFIKSGLYDKKIKSLCRQYRAGKASAEATLADYVWLVKGLLEIYESGKDRQWLDWAQAINRGAHNKKNELFLDKATGAYFEAVANDKNLLFRSKNIYDAALPSANAMALSRSISIKWVF